MKRLIIDTDPGIDDMAAIFFALTSGVLQVDMLTTVFGNVEVEQTTRNALTILETAGREDIPVFSGAARPLIGQATFARRVHGQNGLGDIPLDPPRAVPGHGRAAERIVEAIMATPGEITLIGLGPLTNVALALSIEPRIASAVQQLIIMGGAVRTPGNVTAVASANLFNDAESASIVYSSGAPIVQVGLDVCRPTLITHAHLDRLRDAGNPMSKLLTVVTPTILEFYRQTYGEELGVHYNDVPAVAYAIAPELFASTRMAVLVETAGTLTRGQTVPDWHRQWGMEPNVEVCLEVDATRLADQFTETVARGDVSRRIPAAATVA
ncbi:MAG: nucleoside hydrolase [Chloroflexi bacterium]|nr:nucleoside hydrolase [Chloroflexota bacterium]